MNRKTKYLAATVVAVAALAAGTGFATYRCARAEPAAARADAGLDWLRGEFRLGPGQMARIGALHDAHRLVCEEHCAAILTARARLHRLEAEGAGAAERAAARADARRIDAECRASVDAHVRAVASVIGGEGGERYLGLMRAQVARGDHAGSPELTPERGAAHDDHDGR